MSPVDLSCRFDPLGDTYRCLQDEASVRSVIAMEAWQIRERCFHEDVVFRVGARDERRCHGRLSGQLPDYRSGAVEQCRGRVAQPGRLYVELRPAAGLMSWIATARRGWQYKVPASSVSQVST